MQDFLTVPAFFLMIEGLVYAPAPRFFVQMAGLLQSVPEQQIRVCRLAAAGPGGAIVRLLRG
ncbi:DUF2065 family protein [Rhizobium sp. BG4]|uniref:DUF2065 family protein n=1 Tax=Rhizobium sp. BG4 TaxID=2613770 RepID=UPI00193DB64E|nr:DUF2065 domain-containing protein [Rhizobium sp. BG4]